MKFPNEVDYCEKLLNDIRNNRNEIESYTFPIMMDKHIIRILLKYDLPIKRAYSNFCGQSVRVGGKLSWEEVMSDRVNSCDMLNLDTNKTLYY